ncbi:MAG TPA: hypothetical protein VGF99_19900 [Myxococcota bacterium]
MIRFVVVAFAIAGLLSIVVPFIAIPAFVGSLIAALVAGTSDKRVVVVGVLGVVAATVGLARFTIGAAAPGIVEAGQNMQARNAMYKLREVRLAQDGLRKTAAWDPDGDGIGSAGTLGELVGTRPLRGTKRLEFPLLPTKWERAMKTVKGTDGRDVDVACFEGYCIVVYVPADDELAERRFIAYAWPEADDAVGRPKDPLTTKAGDPRDVLRGQILFVDEHERIYESGNQQGWFGPNKVPPWDAALPTSSWTANPEPHGNVGVDGGTWKPWKGKLPFASLAGDRPR